MCVYVKSFSQKQCVAMETTKESFHLFKLVIIISL